MGARTGCPCSRGGGSPSTRLSRRRARRGPPPPRRGFGEIAPERSGFCACAKAELSELGPTASARWGRGRGPPRFARRRLLVDMSFRPPSTKGGPPQPRRGFGEIAPERSGFCTCAKAELSERGPHRIASDGGEDGAAPLRAEAAPRRHVFPAAEHEGGLSELGPHRIASDGGEDGAAPLRAEAAPRRHVFSAAEHEGGGVRAGAPSHCQRSGRGRGRRRASEAWCEKRESVGRASD
jgi:hypothetical protein